MTVFRSLLCLVLLGGSSGWSQDSVPKQSKPAADKPPVVTIGLIDMATVFKQYRSFASATEKLKVEVGKSTKQIETMQAMATDLAAATAKAKTDAERARLERDFVKVQSEIQSLTTLTVQRLARQEAEIYREIYGDVRATVAEVARERGLTMVIRYSAEGITDADTPKQVIEKLNRLVVFSEDEHDITVEVVARLNASPKKAADTRQPLGVRTEETQPPR